MSATELATVVEGWATLTGLIVVIAGAMFAGVQLRRDSKARRLQALVDLFEVVWSVETLAAATHLKTVPDDFDFDRLDPVQRDAVVKVTASMNRLGHVLRAGLVQEHEIFEYSALSRLPLMMWDKLKHFLRGGASFGSEGVVGFHAGLDFEYLAWRAQSYLVKSGAKSFAAVPIFDPDFALVDRVSRQAEDARVPAA